MLGCSAACLHCQGKFLNSLPVANDDDENDIEPVQQEPPTTTVEDVMDELFGPSSSKRMKI